MAESSLLWDSIGSGDGPATGYTETQVIEFLRDLFTGDQYASMGVFPGVDSELACSSATNQVTVAAGAGMVYGLFYRNTASLPIAVTSPVVGTTGLRVVLRASWAAQTVRATVIKNTDGTSAAPAATQTALTTYDITLATGTITTGGAITLTDARTFIRIPTALLYRRQGGSATDWTTAGTTNFTPGETIVQAGVVNVSYSSGTGTATVTFPTAFSQKPLIQLTVYNAASSTKRKILATVESVSTTQLVIRTYLTDEGTGSSSVDVGWEAMGQA